MDLSTTSRTGRMRDGGRSSLFHGTRRSGRGIAHGLDTNQPGCLTLCNIVLFLLFVFLSWVVVNSWITAVTLGDYRGLGVGMGLLVLVVYVCMKQRGSRTLAQHRHSSPQMGDGAFSDIQLALGLTRRREESLSQTFPTFAFSKEEEEEMEEEAPESTVRGGRSRSRFGTVGDSSLCSICLTDYVEGEDLTLLPCSHCFHVDCIARWASDSHYCPLCKVDFSSMEGAAAASATASAVPEMPQLTQFFAANRV
ncbi:unnamed protein product [Chrysoparadoxa australica]